MVDHMSSIDYEDNANWTDQILWSILARETVLIFRN